MVKLLRLQSIENTLNFDSDLYDILKIPPYSKIGLSSVSWEKQRTVLIVDDSNDKIFINYDDTDGTSHQSIVKLPHVRYSDIHINVFITALNVALNSSLDYAIDKCIGTTYAVTINTNNRLVIKFNTLIYSVLFYNDSGTNNNIAETGGILNSSLSSLDIYDSIYQQDDEVHQINVYCPCGYYRTQIYSLGTGTAGAIIGLNGDLYETMDLDDYYYGIEAVSNGLPYNYIYTDADGAQVTVQSTITVNIVGIGDDNNDVIEIRYSKGRIIGIVYNVSNPSGKVMFDVIYYYQGIKLSACLSLGNDECRITNPLLTSIPNDDTIQNILLSVSAHPTFNFKTADPDKHANYTFTFEKEAVSSFCGWHSVTKKYLNSVKFDFISDTIIQKYDRCETYIVELKNIFIDSYDLTDIKRKKRSLLAIINNQRNKNEDDVVYQPNNALMIELNNKFEIQIRNIELRILNTLEQVINIRGKSDLVLVIE